MKCRKLKSGGYELTEAASFETGIAGCAARIPEYVDLHQSGTIDIGAGYRWDGASGPAIDRRSNMRASLVHDALYQLMRAGRLDPVFRKEADALFRDMVIEDGGYKWIAWIDYVGLRLFGRGAAKCQPEAEEQMLTFP